MKKQKKTKQKLIKVQCLCPPSFYVGIFWRKQQQNEPPMAEVQRGGRPDCKRITLSGGSALQEFFNFLLLNNSVLVRSLDNILHCTLSDQLSSLDRCSGNML